MTKIQNLAGEEYTIENVVLGAGRVVEMEDAMAERFLAEYTGQVEVAGSSVNGESETPKVKRGRKPKVQE